MFFLLLVLFELLLLFLFSKALINALAHLIFHLTKSHRAVILVLATLFLPGTIIHELAHAITAGVLMVPVGEVEFTPQIHEGGIKLGSAKIGRSDPLRTALISLAPTLLGLALILIPLFYLKPSFFVYLILFYLIFVVSNTMFSSKKDLEGVVAGLILMVSILVAFYLLGFREIFVWFSKILEESRSFFERSSLFLLIPLGLDLVVLLATKLVSPRFDNFHQ